MLCKSKTSNIIISTIKASSCLAIGVEFSDEKPLVKLPYNRKFSEPEIVVKSLEEISSFQSQSFLCFCPQDYGA